MGHQIFDKFKPILVPFVQGYLEYINMFLDIPAFVYKRNLSCIAIFSLLFDWPVGVHLALKRDYDAFTGNTNT